MRTRIDSKENDKNLSFQKQEFPNVTNNFIDKRPEIKENKILQNLASNSARTRQLKSLQAMNAENEEKGLAIQKKANKTGLPDRLKSGIENLSGYAMDDVKVYYNSAKPAQLNAYAYAQGTNIHLAPGQEKHLPHEAWHVVQQKQGRVKPTMQMKGKIAVNDDVDLEKEADVMGEKAVNMPFELANAKLPKTSLSFNAVVQRKPPKRSEGSDNIWIDNEAVHIDLIYVSGSLAEGLVFNIRNNDEVHRVRFSENEYYCDGQRYSHLTDLEQDIFGGDVILEMDNDFSEWSEMQADLIGEEPVRSEQRSTVVLRGILAIITKYITPFATAIAGAFFGDKISVTLGLGTVIVIRGFDDSGEFIKIRSIIAELQQKIERGEDPQGRIQSKLDDLKNRAFWVAMRLIWSSLGAIVGLYSNWGGTNSGTIYATIFTEVIHNLGTFMLGELKEEDLT